MRTLFLFLVLLNLVYFVASVMMSPQGPSKQTSVSSALPSGVQRLRLLAASAAYPAVKKTVTSAVSGVAQKPAPALCYSLGPFAKGKDAQAMVAELGKLGASTSVRHIQQTHVTGYWVYLPPYPTTAAAIAVTHELNKKGLHDNYVVATAPNANAVSLGLFIDRNGAQRRLDRVRKMGFKPDLQVRTATTALYWVDYARPAAKADTIAPSVWANAEDGAGPLQRLRRACGTG